MFSLFFEKKKKTEIIIEILIKMFQPQHLQGK